MKTWKNPTIEELDVNQTAYQISGNTADDGFYNGITQDMGMWDDPSKSASHTDDITDELS